MTASISTAVTINAEPATVWKFLSEPEKFLAWMTYLPGSPAPAGSTFEPRPGGALRIIFPNGGEAKGKVIELDPPRRLVFSWGYDPDVAKTGLGPGSCRVELALVPVADGTRVTLTHSGPMFDQLARGHESGWRHYLSQLAVQSAMAHHQAHLGDTLATYFAACNETDDAKRRALLARCADAAIRVRSPFACSDTLEEFSAHIANGLKHMPGCTSGQAGPARHIHGVARVPWKVASPDGKPIFTGENVVRFNAAGRITEIVSFHS